MSLFACVTCIHTPFSLSYFPPTFSLSLSLSSTLPLSLFLLPPTLSLTRTFYLLSFSPHFLSFSLSFLSAIIFLLFCLPILPHIRRNLLQHCRISPWKPSGSKMAEIYGCAPGFECVYCMCERESSCVCLCVSVFV